MNVSGQLHPAALSPAEIVPDTHCTGGWLGFRADMDAVAEKKVPAGNRTPFIHLEA